MIFGVKRPENINDGNFINSSGFRYYKEAFDLLEQLEETNNTLQFNRLETILSSSKLIDNDGWQLELTWYFIKKYPNNFPVKLWHAKFYLDTWKTKTHESYDLWKSYFEEFRKSNPQGGQISEIVLKRLENFPKTTLQYLREYQEWTYNYIEDKIEDWTPQSYWNLKTVLVEKINSPINEKYSFSSGLVSKIISLCNSLNLYRSDNFTKASQIAEALLEVFEIDCYRQEWQTGYYIEGDERIWIQFAFEDFVELIQKLGFGSSNVCQIKHETVKKAYRAWKDLNRSSTQKIDTYHDTKKKCKALLENAKVI